MGEEEIVKLNSTIEHMHKSLEQAKSSSRQATTELEMKLNEIDRLTERLKMKENELLKLQDKHIMISDKYEKAAADIAPLRDEMRTIKSSQSRYNDNIERLQENLEKAKADRTVFEKKSQGLELELAQYSKYKPQVDDLEAALTRSTETARAYHEAKLVALEKIVELEHSLEAASRKTAQLEKEKREIEIEKDGVVHEVLNLRNYVEETKALVEREKAERDRFQVTSQSVRRVQEEARIEIQNRDSLVQEAEEKLLRAENESKGLRESTNTLRQALSQREIALTKESDLRIRLEHEVTGLKASLERAQREISSAATRSANLRSDGRKAHMAIVDAIGMIKNLNNVIDVDAAMLGDNVSGIEATQNKSQSPEQLEVDSPDNDPFSLKEFKAAMGTLDDIAQWVRSVSKDRIELEGNARKLENEKNGLLKEMESLDALHESRIARIKADSKANEDLLSEYRSKFGDVNRPVPVTHTEIYDKNTQSKIALLEAQLVHERGEVDRLNAEVAISKKRLDDKRQQNEQRSYSNEIESLKNDLKNANDELLGVQHHRSVLRETVEKLEKHCHDKNDEIADLKTKVPSDVRGDDGDDEMLRKQSQRYRQRAISLEELVSMYRSAVIALFPDGSSYGAAQFLSTKLNFSVPLPEDSGGVEIRDSNWVEKELNTIRWSYIEEIKLLEGEVSELYTKLRQSSSYTIELKKRFEENLKAMYRFGKNPSADLLKIEIDRLTNSLSQAEAEAQKASMDLSNEKMSSRKRQANLVDDLVKALQSKDSAVTAIKKLEKLCIESGMQQVATFHELEEGLKSAAELGSRYPSGTQFGSSVSAMVPASPAPADLENRWRSEQSRLTSQQRSAGELKRYTSPLVSGSNTYRLQTTGRGLGSLRIGRSLPSALASVANDVSASDDTN